MELNVSIPVKYYIVANFNTVYTLTQIPGFNCLFCFYLLYRFILNNTSTRVRFVVMVIFSLTCPW